MYDSFSQVYGIYTSLSFTDCMHLTDSPLQFNKRIGQCEMQKWNYRAKYNKTTSPDYTETHIPNNWDEPT